MCVDLVCLVMCNPGLPPSHGMVLLERRRRPRVSPSSVIFYVGKLDKLSSA